MARAIAIWLAIWALSSGCDTGVQPVAYDATSPTCVEAANRSDLAWIQDEILTPSCASFTACHRGAALSAGGLNLENGRTLDSTVGVPSSLFPEFNLIEPGDPDHSYFYIIIGGAAGPLDEDVGAMPLNSPPLCSEKVGAIRRWIEGLEWSPEQDAGS